MPRRGTIEKLCLKDFVLTLWETYTAGQIREKIRIEHGHDISEASIYSFISRAKEGRVTQAQQMKQNPVRLDYRKEVEALFEEAVELKDEALQRSRNAEDDAIFIKLASEFARLSKCVLDEAKVLAEMDGRLTATPPGPSTGSEVITGEDLLRAYHGAMAEGDSPQSQG